MKRRLDPAKTTAMRMPSTLGPRKGIYDPRAAKTTTRRMPSTLGPKKGIYDPWALKGP